MKAHPDKLMAQRGWFAACKKAGLDEDARRDFQKVTCGKASAREMTVADFIACSKKLARQGDQAHQPDTRPKAATPHAKKARALWISLHHLGVVTDPRESALAAFVKRQHGVDDLRWLKPDKGNVVIDALKAMATRAGVDWKAYKDTRRCVLSAQWTILTQAGAAPAPDLASHLYTTAGAPGFFAATSRQLDQLIKELGGRVRAVKQST
ncbi:MAG: regulatory protein GemA [Magnetospirillum sp.]|nr:regulatory protein GemA [Magnetospirillum sp.]